MLNIAARFGKGQIQPCHPDRTQLVTFNSEGRRRPSTLLSVWFLTAYLHGDVLCFSDVAQRVSTVELESIIDQLWFAYHLSSVYFSYIGLYRCTIVNTNLFSILSVYSSLLKIDIIFKQITDMYSYFILIALVEKH